MMSKYSLLALLFAGFLTQGCSTPNMGSDYSDYESLRQEAWSAYSHCIESLEPYGRTQECDNVNGDNPYAYQSQQQQTGYYQPVQVQQPNQYYGYYQAPPYYIFSAEPSEVSAMTDKWISLAQDPQLENREAL